MSTITIEVNKHLNKWSKLASFVEMLGLTIKEQESPKYLLSTKREPKTTKGRVKRGMTGSLSTAKASTTFLPKLKRSETQLPP